MSNSQRLQILQQLFADIALKVDDRARGAISHIVLAANFIGLFFPYILDVSCLLSI
jgi:hypothetical protein